METVYVGVGSNIEPETNVIRSLELLKERVQVTAVSQIFTTAPIGRPNQERYANGVFRIETDLGPRELKGLFRSIEDSLGRTRTEDRYAPRTIDLDLVLYGERVIREPGLVVPNPDLLTRPFLAAALLQIAPDLVVPGFDKPLAQLVKIEPGELVVNSRLTLEVARRARYE